MITFFGGGHTCTFFSIRFANLSQEDVNGEKLTVKKWWIFGADFSRFTQSFSRFIRDINGEKNLVVDDFFTVSFSRFTPSRLRGNVVRTFLSQQNSGNALCVPMSSLSRVLFLLCSFNFLQTDGSQTDGSRLFRILGSENNFKFKNWQGPKGCPQKGYPWSGRFLKVFLRNYCTKCPRNGKIWPFYGYPFCGYPFWSCPKEPRNAKEGQTQFF